MPRSPPQTRTKPVLRFRNVWLTLNKTMLCFYTSCFQWSLQAETQKHGKPIYVCTISGPAETRRHWKSHKHSFVSGYPAPRFCHCYPTEYNLTHVHTNLLLIFHQIIVIDKQIPQTIRHTKTPFLLYCGSTLYGYFKVLLCWSALLRKDKMSLVVYDNKPPQTITKITEQAHRFCASHLIHS